MIVKREKFEKTRHVENNVKSKKFILRGERNVRYYHRSLSKSREGQQKNTKTPLSNLLFSANLRVSIPGRVPFRCSQLFQASRYRQFLLIAFVHDDKNSRPLANSEPQTL